MIIPTNEATIASLFDLRTNPRPLISSLWPLLPPTSIFNTFQLISEQSIGTPVVLMITESLDLIFDLLNGASVKRWEVQQ